MHFFREACELQLSLYHSFCYLVKSQNLKGFEAELEQEL